MKTTTTQKAFLANSKNKARLIDKLTTELLHVGVLVKQDPADADHLIVSMALTLAHWVSQTWKPMFRYKNCLL